MGKAAIGSRSYEGLRYPPFARWAVLSDRREVPVTDPLELERFHTCFNLTRRGEPGLSIVVPYPRQSPDREKLLQQIVQEWLVPILRGRLVVEIQGEAIDATSVGRLAAQSLGTAKWEFVKYIVELGAPTIVLPQEKAHPLGRFEDLVDPQILDRMRAAYAKEEVVSARLPVVLYQASPKSLVPSYVDLHLQRLPLGQPSYSLRLRGNITVPDAGRISTEGIASALLATDEAMIEFLADAEPPAHDTWTVTTKLKGNWRYARATVNAVRTAPVRFHALLSAQTEQELPDALLDYFWFQDTTGRPTAGGGRKPKTQEQPAISPPEPRPRRLIVEPDKDGGGFVIRAGGGLKAMPCRIRAEVAYDVESGDAFEAWSPLDFRIDEDPDLTVEAEAADVEIVEGNQLSIDVWDIDFRVRLAGFDRNRDLKVRCDVVSETI